MRILIKIRDENGHITYIPKSQIKEVRINTSKNPVILTLVLVYDDDTTHRYKRSSEVTDKQQNISKIT